MRLRKRLAQERLHRVRDRAQSARVALVQARTTPRYQVNARSSSLCGTFADEAPARRSIERREVCGQASVRRLGSFGFDLPVRNVSPVGCSVELVEPVAVDDHVIARLPGLEPFGARVIWTDERCAGLQFNRPIHSAVFELLLERLGQVAR